MRTIDRRLSKLASTVRQRLQSEHGAALIETAFVVPLLSGLLLLTAGYAQVIYDSIEVSNSAMAGVQYGTRSADAAKDTAGIQLAAANDAPNLALTFPKISTAPACADGSALGGTPAAPTCADGATVEQVLTVQTQAIVPILFRLPGVPATITLYGQATQEVIQ